MRLGVAGLFTLCMATSVPAWAWWPAPEWQRLYYYWPSEETSDSAPEVVTDRQGNAYVAWNNSFPTSPMPSHGLERDFSIVKLNPAGDELWRGGSGGLGDDFATGVAVDSAGGVAVTGYTDTALGSVYNADALTKLGADGTLQWIRRIDTGSHDPGDRFRAHVSATTGVAISAAGFIYVSGWTTGVVAGVNRGREDAFLAKYTASGDRVWVVQFGTAGNDRALAIATGPAGSIYVAGETEGALFGERNFGGRDLWIARYNAAGRKLWAKQVGTAGDESAAALTVGSDGFVYVGGSSTGALFGYPNRGGADAWLAKYNGSGSRLWGRTFGSSGTEIVHGVAAGAAGEVYIAGSTDGSLFRTNLGSTDAWVARIDSAQRVRAGQFGTVSGDAALAAATSTDGLYLSGYQGQEAWIARYAPQP
ncbi:MAG: hypothetical protein U1E35_06095 [Rhodospirillales bacterium]